MTTDNEGKKILAFVDFDDTLVVSAINFWKNYAEFMVWLYGEIAMEKGDNPFSHTPTIHEALTTLETFESQYLSELGYCPERMQKSFVMTMSTFGLEITKERSMAAERFSNAPFDAPLTLSTRIEVALKRLHEFAKIIIWTRGHAHIQEKRILSVGVCEYIDGIHTLHDKNAENLAEVVAQCSKDMKVKNTEIWMVGNSIEHDVLPAMNLGINAVLVGASENSANFFKSFIAVADFTEAVDIILGEGKYEGRRTMSQMFR